MRYVRSIVDNIIFSFWPRFVELIHSETHYHNKEIRLIDVEGYEIVVVQFFSFDIHL